MGDWGAGVVEGQARGARKVAVGGDDRHTPTFEAGLQRAAERAVQRVEFFLIANTRTVRWVEDNQTGWAIGGY